MCPRGTPSDRTWAYPASMPGRCQAGGVSCVARTPCVDVHPRVLTRWEQGQEVSSKGVHSFDIIFREQT